MADDTNIVALVLIVLIYLWFAVGLIIAASVAFRRDEIEK